MTVYHTLNGRCYGYLRAGRILFSHRAAGCVYYNNEYIPFARAREEILRTA